MRACGGILCLHHVSSKLVWGTFFTEVFAPKLDHRLRTEGGAPCPIHEKNFPPRTPPYFLIRVRDTYGLTFTKLSTGVNKVVREGLRPALKYKCFKNKYTHMKLYANVKILALDKKNFADEDGKTVEYYEAYVKDEEGSVLRVGAGVKDRTKYEGSNGIGAFDFRFVKDREGIERPKLTLKDFVEGESFAVPEGEIN